jgi:FKBP-type peptidyl-prolyl cis-trans isomerase FklB
MTSEETRSTITSLQQRLMAAQQKALKEQAAKNLSETKAFLAESGKKEGIKTLPSGLQY